MGKLSAGWSEVIITPPVGTYLAGYFEPRKSIGVHDDLYARALFLSDENVDLAIVVCDLLCVDKEIVKGVREIVREELGVPEDNVMIAATHTHTGPYTVKDFMGSEKLSEEYFNVLPKLIAGAVIEAYGKLKEVKMGLGLGREDSVVFNRRYFMRDGSVVTNPGRGNPNIVKPAGPIDPQVGVIRLDNLNGEIGCIFINYTNHVDVIGGKLISADYPGVVCKFVKRVLGDDVGCVYSNGAFGDVNHINVYDLEQKKGFEESERIGLTIGCEALRTALKIKAKETDVKLSSVRKKVELPLRRVSEEEVRRAKETLRKKDISLKERVYANEILLLYQRGEDYVKIELQAFRIGDCVLVGVPGELFVELGLKIKSESSFKYTFIIGVANGYIGYIPTSRAFDEGGYEVRTCRHSKVAKGSGEQLVDYAVSLIHKLS